MAYLSVFLYFSLLDLLDRWFDYELYKSFCATFSLLDLLDSVRLRTLLSLRLQFLFHNPDLLTLQRVLSVNILHLMWGYEGDIITPTCEV